jgi:hypothetical protein
MWPRWITGGAIALFVIAFVGLSLGGVRTPSFGKWDLAILVVGLAVVLAILFVARGWPVALLFGSGLLLSLLAGPVAILMAGMSSPKAATVGVGLGLDLAGLGLLIASVIMAIRRHRT